MNSKRLLALTLIALIGLTGCAGMNEQECLVSDWTAVGYEDGSNGAASDRFGNYRQACAKHGVAPDFQAWQSGRERGLVEYCQPSRGFYLGESGGRYYGVCNSNLEADFLDAYRLGSQLYTLRSDVNSATYQINSNRQQIDQLDSAMIEAGVLIAAAETSTEERILLLADIKNMSERKGELEEEMDYLMQERARAEVELQAFEATLLARGY